ncbi:hypothetical protein AB0F17_22325 [Nonomuraea sp. NPDC026600]|uniref:hypothetical protein n=1 Tax=Nonomuraea sp. NPDC026600 TaxID=3155363 RepID=UPI0033F21B13
MARIHYGTAAPRPYWRELAPDEITRRAASLPSKLWPSWTMPLLGPHLNSGFSADALRTAASAMLMLPGTLLDYRPAADLLASEGGRRSAPAPRRSSSTAIPLRDFLHQQACAQLDRSGIDEPLAWEPPGSWVTGADWPGFDPDAIDEELALPLIALGYSAKYMLTESRILQLCRVRDSMRCRRLMRSECANPCFDAQPLRTVTGGRAVLAVHNAQMLRAPNGPLRGVTEYRRWIAIRVDSIQR